MQIGWLTRRAKFPKEYMSLLVVRCVTAFALSEKCSGAAHRRAPGLVVVI